MLENAKVITLEAHNKSEFSERLLLALFEKFNVTRTEDLPENYSLQKSWSLLQMLEDDALDTYQLIYVKDKIWGGSGGMIRDLDNGHRIYQAGFRTFTHSTPSLTGLGTKPYITGICVRHQIARARLLNCEQVVLSFNESNKRLFNLVQKYHHQSEFLGVNELMKDFSPSPEPVLFNGVPQWLLQMNLK